MRPKAFALVNVGQGRLQGVRSQLQRDNFLTGALPAEWGALGALTQLCAALTLTLSLALTRQAKAPLATARLRWCTGSRADATRVLASHQPQCPGVPAAMR